MCLHKNTVQAIFQCSWNQKNCTGKRYHFYSNFTFCSSFIPRPSSGDLSLDHTEGRKSPDPLAPPILHNSWSTLCEPPPLWNIGYANGETHPNYHPFKALGCGSSRHTGVMWGHPILDIIRHVTRTKYSHNFLIKRHQCCHNCCHNTPYITLICTKSSVGWGSASGPTGGLTALPTPFSFI